MKKKSLLIFIMLFGMFLFPNIVQAQDNYINLYNLMKENASADTVNFSVNSMISGTNGIYTTTATEGNVPVYYYRGAANQVNNNLIFNNMCWKIIRTTETGGVKLIYNGTPNANGECVATGEDTQIGSSAFNTNYNGNAYVGYMYGTAGSITYEATHANENDSTIKTYIDNWYTTNFTDTSVTSKLEDTVFCNDRSTVAGGVNNTSDSSVYGTKGFGTNATGYGALARASYNTITPSPSLKCTNANDKFTVSASKGNGKLKNPVGLITLDEVVLAGFNTYASDNSNYNNTTNYLYTNGNYWTFSPVLVYAIGDAYVGRVSSAGRIYRDAVSASRGVRPVVSLADGTLVTTDGDGSTTNPYVVLDTYKVSFETNTNTEIVDITLYGNNSKVNKPNDLTKEGYKFAGWYIDEELTNEYDFDTVVTEDITLYAKWDKNYSYTFIEGDNQEFESTKVDNYKFRVDGDYDLFDSLVIDGLKLEKDKDYKVTEGSTIIEFTESGLAKLNTLEAKEYDIQVLYTNGKQANGKLIINEPEKEPEKVIPPSSPKTEEEIENPKTFDGIMTWIILSVVSVIGFVGAIRFRKKLYNK